VRLLVCSKQGSQIPALVDESLPSPRALLRVTGSAEAGTAVIACMPLERSPTPVADEMKQSQKR
jgi:hypothetical protein